MMTHQHIVELSVGRHVRGVGLSSIDLEWLYGQGFFPETIGGSQHILRRDYPSNVLGTGDSSSLPVGLERRIHLI